MPKLGGKKYSYDKKGVRNYIKALKKKRKKGYEAGDQASESVVGGEGG